MTPNRDDLGATMPTRGRKARPGRITFVGSGPGDPGLLTTRAAAVLANAALVFTDPDVPEPLLAPDRKAPAAGLRPGAGRSAGHERRRRHRPGTRPGRLRRDLRRRRHPPGAGGRRRGGPDAHRR